MKATGTEGASAKRTANPAATTEATASMTEDQPDVAGRQPGGDDGSHGEAEQVEDLDRGDEVGTLDGVEVERLLILQGGQGREAGNGCRQERQRDEDPAEHTDLPDRPPGLAEGRWRFDRVTAANRQHAAGVARAGVGQRGAARRARRRSSARHSSSCSWRPRGGSRRRSPTMTTTAIGIGEEVEGRTPGPDGGEPRPEQDADDGAEADARPVRRVDARTGGDRVVVSQQGIVGGEDDRLTHGDARQHDGRHHDRRRGTEPDGERGAHDGADQRDAHPVGSGRPRRRREG